MMCVSMGSFLLFLLPESSDCVSHQLPEICSYYLFRYFVIFDAIHSIPLKILLGTTNHKGKSIIGLINLGPFFF